MRRKSNWSETPATEDQINFARSLAKTLGVSEKYQWNQSHWTKEEISWVINGFRKRLGFK